MMAFAVPWPSPRYTDPPREMTVTWDARPEGYYVDPDPWLVFHGIALLVCLYALALLVAHVVRRRRRASVAARPVRSRLAGAAGVALAVISFFFFLELFMAFALRDMYNSAFAPEPVLLWTLRPGFSGVYPPIGEEPFSINSRGFRGPELPAKKRPGVVRIFIVGDSFSFGLKVRNDEIYAHFLPGALGRLDPVLAVEVVNGAVPGYCSLQALHRLRRDGLPLRPDIVVVAFLVNDTLKSYAPEKDLIPSNPALLAARDILYRSRTFIAMKKLSLHLMRQSAEPKAQKELHIDRVAPDDYRRNLEEIVGLVRANRVKALFLDMPNIERTDVHERYRAIFLDVAKRNGIPALDCYHRWHREIPLQKLDRLFVESRGFRHPTPEGHRMIAQELAAFLLAHRAYYFK